MKWYYSFILEMSDYFVIVLQSSTVGQFQEFLFPHQTFVVEY